MSFDEVRLYQPGDDIRRIDWNVSARSNDVYVKQFVEERELTVMILVDMSGSLDFGTGEETKRKVATFRLVSSPVPKSRLPLMSTRIMTVNSRSSTNCLT